MASMRLETTNINEQHAIIMADGKVLFYTGLLRRTQGNYKVSF